MSTIPSSNASGRARRALTHGSGIDGILFSLLTMGGVAVLFVMLVYSFQAAEKRAEQDTARHSTVTPSENTELGDNTK